MALRLLKFQLQGVHSTGLVKSSSLSTIIGIFYDLDGHNRESLKYVINRVARLNRYGTKGVTTIISSSFSFIRPRIPKSWILNHKWTSNSFPSHLSSFLLSPKGTISNVLENQTFVSFYKICRLLGLEFNCECVGLSLDIIII